MKRWLFPLFAIILAGCSIPTPAPSPNPANQSYPDQGAAPEIAGDVWLNSDAPLRLADLRGKVVLLEMWTFG